MDDKKLKERIEKLVLELEDSRSSSTIRKLVKAHLRDIEIGKKVPALVGMLESEEWSVRIGAVYELGSIAKAISGNAELMKAVHALVEALTDEKLSVRKESAGALGKIAKANPSDAVVGHAVPALIKAMKDKTPAVRRAAASALGSIANANPGDAEIEKAVPAMMELLKDFDKFVRMRAALALGKAGGSSAVPALVEALKDEKDVQFQVFQSLSEISDKAGSQTRTLITNSIIRLIQSEWFYGEMRKNSPSYVRTAKLIANLLSKLKVSEQIDVALEPKINPPSGSQGTLKQRRKTVIR
jgi:HEAT repeat protein